MSLQNRPIRILHLTVDGGALGVGRYLFNLSRAIGAQDPDHDITIVGDQSKWCQLYGESDWKCLNLPLWGKPIEVWQHVRTLRQYLIKQPVDILQTHCRWSTLIGRMVSRRLGLLVLQTLHTSGGRFGLLNRCFSDFGDHTHVVSEQSRQWLIEKAHVPDQRITVIPHGIDTSAFPVANASQQREARQAMGIAPDALVAGFVGRLEEWKNVSWMLDLAQTPQHRLPGLRVLIVGQGSGNEQIHHRIKIEGLSKRVTVLKQCDPLQVYQASDAIFLPSKREGFSMVCAEAMSTGRPVLRTRTAGTAEQIVEGVTGRSIPIERTTFVQAAIKFLSDRSELHRMGEAAGKHVREHLTIERQLSSTLDLYHRLIAAQNHYDLREQDTVISDESDESAESHAKVDPVEGVEEPSPNLFEPLIEKPNDIADAG